ncbi:hypothetical protein V6N13_004289 [Hibiscus sabdariffa]|uniref:RING-type E3 ubiquitin transferase n=1 Tax=Hibiscus sabdariffa TaxID=183260 RepID=A0ABR2RYV3_9ROSI
MAVVPISINVHELGVIRGARPVPADDIQVKFIIAIDIRRMDPISGHSTPYNTNPFSPFQLLSFGLSILQDQDRLRQVLDPKFAGVGIDTSSVAYNAMVQEIMERGLGAARRRVDVESRCRDVFLGCVIRAVLTETDTDRDASLTTALAESESEFERENYGMVAAREASIEELLERFEVVAGDETCVVCLNELEVGFEAARMPCSHCFHGDCIRKWLTQSHYCPICRFEMPTNQI